MKLNYNYIVNEDLYGHTQTGHIYGIQDVYNANNSRHYEYDRWYRLTGYWVSNARTDPFSKKITWAYDQYGNITSITTWVDPNNCPYPEGCTTNFSINPATNRMNNWTYDAAGNTTSKGTFDAENRLLTSGSLSFLYDGNSRRLRRLQGSNKIYYVYSATGRLIVEDNWPAAKTKNHVYFNGQLIATHDQADYVRMIFKDHLGSTRSVARVTPVFPWGETWETTEVYDYYPYGDQSSFYSTDPDNTDERFTGQKHDGSSLNYFGARYYFAPLTWVSSDNPRWISADPIIEDPYDPESLNKYAYVRGDPINLIDLDGKRAVCIWIVTEADIVLEWFMPFRPVSHVWAFCFTLRPPSRTEPDEAPKCFVELRFRRINDDHVPRGISHSYYFVKDRTGAFWIIEGGPRVYEDDPKQTQYLEASAVRTIKKEGGSDSTKDSLHWRSEESAAMCLTVARMIRYANSFPRRNLVYDPINGPNSNSFARYLALLVGLEGVTSPPGAWGWEFLVVFK